MRVVGLNEGSLEGILVVGSLVGLLEGRPVGLRVGLLLGARVVGLVGSKVGSKVVGVVGSLLGETLGASKQTRCKRKHTIKARYLLTPTPDIKSAHAVH